MKYKELEAQRECDLKRKIKIKYGIEGVIDYILSKSNIPITLDLLVDEYNSGAFLSDLSQKYGIPIGDITRIFDLKNIKRRSPHENTKLFNDTKLKNIIKEKYGVENVFQLSETKEKIKKTNLEKYGAEYYSQTEECKEKVKQTFLDNYGTTNVFSSDYGKKKIKESLIKNFGSLENAYSYRNEKSKESILEKYGSIENYYELRNEKLREACLNKYGVENVFQLSEVKEKIKKTNLEKYGCENPLQNDSIKEKVKQTCLEKYGVDNFSKTKDFCKKRKKKYSYNGESFDSSWELAFYVYHTDLGEKVEHETTEFIYYYNGIEYKYIPDFKIQNTYYEIKGNHFFNENKMINPFDPSQNDLYEAKHKCGLDNGVVFLKEEDLKKELDYLNKNYKFLLLE